MPRLSDIGDRCGRLLEEKDTAELTVSCVEEARVACALWHIHCAEEAAHASSALRGINSATEYIQGAFAIVVGSWESRLRRGGCSARDAVKGNDGARLARSRTLTRAEIEKATSSERGGAFPLSLQRDAAAINAPARSAAARRVRRSRAVLSLCFFIPFFFFFSYTYILRLTRKEAGKTEDRNQGSQEPRPRRVRAASA